MPRTSYQSIWAGMADLAELPGVTYPDRFLAGNRIVFLLPSIAALAGLVSKRPRSWSPCAIVGLMFAGWIVSGVVVVSVFLQWYGSDIQLP